MNIVNDKVAKLDADLLEMALHLEEKIYPHLLNTISGQRWLLTRGLRLVVVKCLDSHEYLFALEAAISRAIEKGMQDGLSAGIDHGKAGRSLEDVVAYNPSMEEDYPSTFQSLREVDFPLLAELKSHKDASITNVMDLLHLEGQLANALGMSDLQLHVDQLMLLVHRSEDQVVLVETSLSFALNVTHSYDERIRENVEARRSTPIGVWTPLVDPLSIENLIGDVETSNRMPVIAATTTALSITFASASTVPPITIEDYEIIGTDGPEDAEGSSQAAVASFPNTIDMACLIALVDEVSRFETCVANPVLKVGMPISTGLPLLSHNRAIEKGMQDGLSAGIDHGKAGRSLEDVVAYNPSVEEDYPSTFQRLCEVDFPLLAKLKSHKDASITNVMDLLHLEGQLANSLGMSDLQIHVDQLMLLVYRSEDQVIMGTDGPEDAEGSSQAAAASFPITVEFEKKELDTTPDEMLAGHYPSTGLAIPLMYLS
nr:nonaspanin [Tanacetum cinerariifolium]